MIAKDTALPPSFVGLSGNFYIRQHRADGSGYSDRVTKWPSVDSYNKRTPVALEFCDVADALLDFSHELKIYSESLTTTPPVYEPDRDESDRGLTPIRNIWADRLQRAREGRSHVA
ncbi:hypothetical protein [Spirosoma fluminis]